MTTLNIVNLIESNPITQLSDTYNNRLLEKIKESFSETEQQLFVTSFYCYLNHNASTEFIIDLDNVWQWLGFNKKCNAKRMLENNFMMDTDYKCLLLRSEEQSSDTRGGHNREKILLNIHTFKKLCMKAGTKKANEVHNYFIKLETLLHEVLKEQSQDLIRQLKNSETEKQSLESNIISLRQTNELDKHNMLLQEYHRKNLVYILKLETLSNGHFVVKIGETSDIRNRIQALNALFGIKVIIMDLFPCDFHYKLEQFLHREPMLTQMKYTNLINHKQKSTEAYLVPSMQKYNKIKQFILKHSCNFNSKNGDLLKTTVLKNICEIYKDDKDGLERMMDKIHSIYQCQPNRIVEPLHPSFAVDPIEDVTGQIPSSCIGPDVGGRKPGDIASHEINSTNNFFEEQDPNDVMNDAIEQVSETSNPETTPITKANAYCPKVQIYDPNDLTRLVRVYESITDCTRRFEGTSYTHVKYAARHRTIYKGYRWYLAAAGDNPYEPKRIGETVQSNEKRSGMVAMVNVDKTKVMRVFSLQKEAAKYCSIHASLICSGVRFQTIVHGHYWIPWEDVDNNLQQEFLRSNSLPTVAKQSRGSTVQQISPQTGVVEREFPSIVDCCKELRISTNSIKKSSAEDVVINGWKYKIM